MTIFRVPNNISFGHGVSRGFLGGGRSRGRGRGQRLKKGHWHSKGQGEIAMDTSVDIEHVDMTDLADALT